MQKIREKNDLKMFCSDVCSILMLCLPTGFNDNETNQRNVVCGGRFKPPICSSHLRSLQTAFISHQPFLFTLSVSFPSFFSLFVLHRSSLDHSSTTSTSPFQTRLLIRQNRKGDTLSAALYFCCISCSQSNGRITQVFTVSTWVRKTFRHINVANMRNSWTEWYCSEWQWWLMLRLLLFLKSSFDMKLSAESSWIFKCPSDWAAAVNNDSDHSWLSLLCIHVLYWWMWH